MPSVFAESKGVCICSREKQSKNADFSQFRGSFKQPWNGEALQTKAHRAPAVFRPCFAKSLIRGALPKASAQKTPTVPRPTLAAVDCSGLAAPFVDRREIRFLRARLNSCCTTSCKMLSALSATVLAILRLPTTSTDGGNTERIRVLSVLIIERKKKTLAD